MFTKKPESGYSDFFRETVEIPILAYILATMVLGSHTVDKIVVSEINVVHVRASQIIDEADTSILRHC